ncbi:MAG: tRNA (guanosine(37)-N1)-methyltransferase TrmD [Rhodospirillaceae bacterium]|nr:MAG: tRNA (guanosine(37)-N1)-methyltransferase TrmD [Rhodospirillaceae bacterium]
MSFQATILTLFPEMFPGPLGQALAGKALEAGQWTCAPVNIRDFTENRHNKVDEMPYGGGAGLVMSAQPVDDALRAVVDRPGPLVFMTPRGAPLTQRLARDLSTQAGVKILCGRYEGIDQRVIEKHAPLEVSVGDYVLSGGEIGALVLLDAIIRLLPGVMGNAQSGTDESFEDGLLEHPHYTRPAEWQGRTVPSVLLSGDHKAIARWRAEQAMEITAARRPDLLDQDQAAAAEPVSTERKGP